MAALAPASCDPCLESWCLPRLPLWFVIVWGRRSDTLRTLVSWPGESREGGHPEDLTSSKQGKVGAPLPGAGDRHPYP